MVINQFHQYQQNKQLPLILTELTEQKKDHDICGWCMNILSFWYMYQGLLFFIYICIFIESVFYLLGCI